MAQILLGQYKTGTVTVATGSPTVTGVGTAWAANVKPGALLTVGPGDPSARIAAVVDDATLTLESPWPGANYEGASYAVVRDFDPTSGAPLLAYGDTNTVATINRAIMALSLQNAEALATSGNVLAAQNAATTATVASNTATQQAAAASGSAGAAAASAQTAQDAAGRAQASQVAVAAAFAAFGAMWLGKAASDPTKDASGNALQVGAEYWNTTSNKVRVYTASGWMDQDAAAQADVTNAALAASNAAGSAAGAYSSANAAAGSAATATISANAAQASALAAAGSAGTAQAWASQASGTVDGTSYSAKVYAGNAATSAAAADTSAQAAASSNTLAGQANRWAQAWASQASGTVDATSYSAKYYALQAGGSATAAATSATNAAASATAAANSAALAAAYPLPAASPAAALAMPRVNAGGTAYEVRTPTQVVADLGLTTQPSFRNLVINGAMAIDQEHEGAAVAAPSGFCYVIDQWGAYCSQAGRAAIGRNLGGWTPPPLFPNYLGYKTGSAAYALASGDAFNISNAIEAQTVAHLGWGTAAARPITLSFWVSASMAGTFSGAIQNYGGSRSCVFTYTIPTAFTWTYVSVTIPGDTGGTWATGTQVGMYVVFSLGYGSAYQTAPGAWVNGNYGATPGAVSLLATANATWALTGVQVEAGSIATPFERRPIGVEMDLCQRYFQKSHATGVSVGAVNPAGIVCFPTAGTTVAAAQPYGTVCLRTPMRLPPTVTIRSYNGTVGSMSDAGGIDLGASSGIAVNIGDRAFMLQNQSGAAKTANGGSVYCHYTADARM